MSLRAKSHTDLQAAGKSPLDDSLCTSFSMSSSSVNRGGRFGSGVTEEVKVLPRPPRRPVRAVRPVSAINANGSFLQINHLQGELVRKRKECEDLRKENKYLSNEIHMERIVLRTESELTMRNLRSLNQELQAQVKELNQKLYQSQQRATLCSHAAGDAEESRAAAEKGRALAEARALACQRDRDAAEADRGRLSEEMRQLKKDHTDLQLLLAQTERNYFETQLKLDRASGEKQALLQDNGSLKGDRDDLRHQLRQVTQENVQVKERHHSITFGGLVESTPRRRSWVILQGTFGPDIRNTLKTRGDNSVCVPVHSESSSRRRAMASEEESKKAHQAQREAEAERRLAEKERQERTSECLSWRERHQELADRFRAQEELTALRQNKAEGDPVYISTPESGPEEPERSSSR
ncbi:putative caldesmon-like [Scophthalmus maximus]|uniref:Putative caldesmon-like n=1 Tax=Scophthalmus maximus TaxID=52904 RepID=A0A2U9BVZ6_SCOMX|nr:putative caldesmon-like [Scophthalmus maximus]